MTDQERLNQLLEHHSAMRELSELLPPSGARGRISSMLNDIYDDLHEINDQERS
jgi:hypothetical protein